jgi:hypothetical protein
MRAPARVQDANDVLLTIVRRLDSQKFTLGPYPASFEGQGGSARVDDLDLLCSKQEQRCVYRDVS